MSLMRSVFLGGAFASAAAAAGSDNPLSPCPILNVMAKLGDINEDGQQITADEIATALNKNLNLDFDGVKDFANLAVRTVGKDGTLNLPDLSKTKGEVNPDTTPLEHDASLSRMDAAEGDNLRFSNMVWSNTASYFFENTDALTEKSAVHGKRAAEERAQAAHDDYSLEGPQKLQSWRDVALLMLTFGVPGQDGLEVPKDVVDSLFVDEKLPEGWQMRTEPVTLVEMAEFATHLEGIYNATYGI